MRSTGAALLLATVACHATQPLEAPAIDDGASILFIGERNDEITFVSAYDLDDKGRAPLSAPSSLPGDRWWVLSFACSLSFLGLEEGSVLLADEALLQSPIPPPLAARSLSPNEGGSWQIALERSAVVEDALRRLSFPATNRCELAAPTFETDVSTFDMPEQALLYDPTFAAVLDDGTVFVTMMLNNDIVITSSVGYTATILDLDADTASPIEIDGGPFLDGYEADDGEIWLLTPTSVLRGVIPGPFITAFMLDVPVRFGRMVGRGGGNRIELSITATNYDGVNRDTDRYWLYYDGTTLEQLTIDSNELRMPVSKFVGPGHLVAINAATNPATFHELRDGQLTRIPVVGEPLIDVSVIPALGIATRTAREEVFIYEDGALEPFDLPLPFITTYFPTSEYLLLAGESISARTGRLLGGAIAAAQLADWPRLCRYPAGAPGSARLLVPTNDDATLLSVELTYTIGLVRATTITLTRGPEACTQRSTE